MTYSTLKLEIMTALSVSALILSHTSNSAAAAAAAADDATVSSNLRKNKNMRQEKSLLPFPGPIPNQPVWRSPTPPSSTKCYFQGKSSTMLVRTCTVGTVLTITVLVLQAAAREIVATNSV